MNTLALAGLILALVASPSPEPSPTPSPVAEIQQEHRNSETPTRKASEQPILGAIQTPEPAKPQSDQHSNEPTSNWGLLFAAIVAGAAAVQVWVMIIQARYMRRGLLVSIKASQAARDSASMAKKAVELAEKNTAITERAVILLESIRAEPPAARDAWHLNPNTILMFTLKNYGTTVAHDVKVIGDLVLKTLPEEKRIILHGSQGATIAPQGTNKWITSSLSCRFSQEDFPDINGDKLFQYHVMVTYSDAFGTPHKYLASGQYIPALRDFISGSSKTLD